MMTATGYLRPMLGLVLILATLAAGWQGLALGLAAICVNEMAGLRLRLMNAEVRGDRRRVQLRMPARLRRLRLPRERFPTFDTVAADVGWAQRSPRDADAYLLKHLRRIADARLMRHGLSLDRLAATPARAQDLLGETTWQFVDPNRRRSRDSDSKGVSLATVNRMLDDLEKL